MDTAAVYGMQAAQHAQQSALPAAAGALYQYRLPCCHVQAQMLCTQKAWPRTHERSVFGAK